MSANLDLARSIVASWERGDFSSTEWADSEIEFVFADGPSPGSFRGVANMSESWREFLRNWRDVHAEAEEFLELDDERVLVGSPLRSARAGVPVRTAAPHRDIRKLRVFCRRGA